jgi:S-adenosylmethionine:tRNA ribosyltransferase-isomerase
MQEHEMHAEFIEVSADTILQLLQANGQTIVVVGTTSLRTIESLYWMGVKLLSAVSDPLTVHQWDPYELPGHFTPAEALTALLHHMQQQHMQKLITKTQIIIAPGYQLRVAKGIITNFHQPQSTLLLLVAAITGNHWKDIYQYALDHNFRFLSYGDGSLLWNRATT